MIRLMAFRRGRLLDTSEHPPEGERFHRLAEVRNVIVEQILSSDDVEPVDYDQPQDEWVVVLAGDATLEIEGEQVELTTGDWLLLPAHTPHRVLRTAAGTSWLAVHVH